MNDATSFIEYSCFGVMCSCVSILHIPLLVTNSSH